MKQIIIFSYFIFSVCVLHAQKDNSEEIRGQSENLWTKHKSLST